MNGVLLDTSFLISYSAPSRPNHTAAVDYWKEFVSRQVPMHLSTIVVAEFQVRQSVTSLGLQNFIPVPFNIDHAIAAARLIDPARSSNAAQNRTLLKDDVKLLAQCMVGGISHFISEDGPCLKNLALLRKQFTSLPVGIDLNDGFDPAWFNPGNQTALI